MTPPRRIDPTRTALRVSCGMSPMVMVFEPFPLDLLRGFPFRVDSQKLCGLGCGFGIIGHLINPAENLKYGVGETLDIFPLFPIPLTPALSPAAGGEGRVRGLSAF